MEESIIKLNLDKEIKRLKNSILKTHFEKHKEFWKDFLSDLAIKYYNIPPPLKSELLSIPITKGRLELLIKKDPHALMHMLAQFVRAQELKHRDEFVGIKAVMVEHAIDELKKMFRGLIPDFKLEFSKSLELEFETQKKEETKEKFDIKGFDEDFLKKLAERCAEHKIMLEMLSEGGANYLVRRIVEKMREGITRIDPNLYAGYIAMDLARELSFLTILKGGIVRAPLIKFVGGYLHQEQNKENFRILVGQKEKAIPFHVIVHEVAEALLFHALSLKRQSDGSWILAPELAVWKRLWKKYSHFGREKLEEAFRWVVAKSNSVAKQKSSYALSVIHGKRMFEKLRKELRRILHKSFRIGKETPPHIAENITLKRMKALTTAPYAARAVRKILKRRK
ncbi:MAG: hypothetical protein DRO04_01930 [Candidatus Iainarchaeum archaeon]|uniref:Uncharacterized protein n=1 Tax=Candidatus Iainarchaeum sp. TaxID=3101447 RepID=A0A497JIK0_9ARCH|nr:MAG: hypothetical protein DRO04_01930 [Candidatus Diapherotrites archaeon]